MRPSHPAGRPPSNRSTVAVVPGQGGSIAHTWRVREAATLAKCWDRARAGEPVMVLVRGDAGAGKTRLVRGLVERAEADGAVVVSGAAVDVGEQLPCWPVASALRRLLATPDGAPAPARAARAALEPWREE